MKKTNRKCTSSARPAILCGVAVGSLALCLYLYTDILTTVIARRRSRVLERLTKKKDAPIDPDAEIIRHSEEVMRSLPTEAVSITARDGTPLRGHWYHAESPRRLLIMVHGWHSTWCINFGTSAPFYHGCGCELLFIEQRCHGESGGKMISYGIKERFDVLDWLDYAQSVHPELPVYLCGLSMGASTVLMTAGEPVADRVTAVIADCGYTSPKEVVAASVKKRIGPATGPTMAAVNLNCRLRGGFGLDDYSTLTAMDRDTDIPVLFIHGDADTLVPCRMSMENYIACRAPKELYIVHDAPHATAYLKETEAYQARVKQFFATWDHRLDRSNRAGEAGDNHPEAVAHTEME